VSFALITATIARSAGRDAHLSNAIQRRITIPLSFPRAKLHVMRRRQLVSTAAA